MSKNALKRFKFILLTMKMRKDRTVQIKAGKITISLVWLDCITCMSYSPLVFMRAIAAIGIIRI